MKEKGFEVVQVQGSASARPEIAFVMDGNPVGMENLMAKADAGEISREQLTKLTAPADRARSTDGYHHA